MIDVKAIEDAVCNGIKRAAGDMRGDLQTALYNAIYGALKKLAASEGGVKFGA